MIVALDHLVLTVKDIDITCDFYRCFLGMEVRIFGDGRTALHFPGGKINLHQAEREPEPKAHRPTPGSADLCFLIDQPVAGLARTLSDANIQIIEGPAPRTGSQGPIESVYFRDPDGNLLEAANQL